MAATQNKLCSANLDAISEASPSVALPKYDRAKITPGIVHIGVGNFHRAHQCVFADDALGLPGHEAWGMVGVGLMPGDSKMRDVLQEQDMLYTLWEKGTSSSKLRIMGCHSKFVLAPSEPDVALELLSSPATKIVTLTVTEKGYFIDFGTGTLDTSSPIVQGDISFLKSGKEDPITLKTAAGYIVAAARRRHASGTKGFAVLSCDNVQENGCKAKGAVLQMADAVDEKIAAWIRENVTFPNSMVDRITPATTDEVRAELTAKHGIVDGWPVVSESFLLWVVEDKFPQGRPSWEKSKNGQCLFVEDVVPYELMKLRLLNAVHQALSYPASLLGHELVHDAMADTRVSEFLKTYMAAAGKTVPPVKGLAKNKWCQTVIERFSNPAIRDTIFRLNEDATNRIAVALAPCLAADAVGPNKSLSDADMFAVLLPVACWLRCLLKDESDGAGAMPAAAKLNRDDKGEVVSGPAMAAWKAAKADDMEAAQDAAAKFLVAAFGAAPAGPSRPEVAKALVEQLKLLQGPGGVVAALDGVRKKVKPLKKPTFKDIGKIEPEQRGINIYGKVMKSPESVGSGQSQVVIGDSSAVVTIRAPDDRITVCEEGNVVRVQNARVIMVKGHINVLVDKWAALKKEDKDVGTVKTANDISAVEYELS